MNGKQYESDMPVSIAWYRPEQWQRWLRVVDDRDSFEGTFEEWEANATEQLATLRGQGLRVQKIQLDVDEVQHWCLMQKRLLNAEARSEFAAESARRSHEGGRDKE